MAMTFSRREARALDEAVRYRTKRVPFKEHLALTDRQTWVTRDGRRLAPSEMSYNHVRNTVHLLRRWGEREKFEDELFCIAHISSDMSDGAYDAVSSEAHGLGAMTAHQFCMGRVPVYGALCRELRMRAMG